MKKNELKTEKPPLEMPKLIRQKEAIRAVQSEGILRRLIAGGWLTPCVRERKYTAYRRSDVEQAVQRILSGEMPPPLHPRPQTEKAI